MNNVLTTQRQLRIAKHVPGLMFLCNDCKQIKPVQAEGGTGYGYPAENEPDADKPVCYDCCGKRDITRMVKTGKAVLYLSKSKDGAWQVGNWPGTIRFNASVKEGRHNIAHYRWDAWFTGPDKRQWHGVQYGNMTQLLHCKRISATS